MKALDTNVLVRYLVVDDKGMARIREPCPRWFPAGLSEDKAGQFVRRPPRPYITVTAHDHELAGIRVLNAANLDLPGQGGEPLHNRLFCSKGS